MIRFRVNSDGFTAIELIVVIVTLGILVSAIVLARPFSIDDYGPVAADQLIADIRYVQMKATGMKAQQTITFFVNPSDRGVYSVAGTAKKLPGNVVVASSDFTTLTFNSLGEPSTNGQIRLSGNRLVTVYASTGKAE